MKSCTNTTEKIYFWSTNQWVFQGNNVEDRLDLLSEDCGILEVPCEATLEEIDLLVEKKLKEGWGNDS